MKKRNLFSLILALSMTVGMLAGCGGQKASEPEATTSSSSSATEESGITAPEADVDMQFISVDDAKTALDDDSYVFFDVRKAADYDISHIPGSESYDMDAAKEGDFDAGVATMQAATNNLDKNIVVICYSGKAYAQATTNVLSALGYDMSKVYTLEGGFTAWTKADPDAIEAGFVAPESDVEMQYISLEDASQAVGSEDYAFFDVRKVEDYETAHIPGAESYDMDAAKEGSFNAGVATMQPAIRGLDKNIVVICYSGKSYAQATTNVLSALGYDMSKVYTLEGGFNAWSETYPDNVE